MVNDININYYSKKRHGLFQAFFLLQNYQLIFDLLII